jgi:hypothetical protein
MKVQGQWEQDMGFISFLDKYCLLVYKLYFRETKTMNCKAQGNPFSRDNVDKRSRQSDHVPILYSLRARTEKFLRAWGTPIV